MQAPTGATPVVLSAEPLVAWMEPAPLWASAQADTAQLRRPALLGFATDGFMEDLAALLGSAPEALANLLAHPESFRARPPGQSPDWAPIASTLKLFQPVHGRFYLVAASLVCRLTGFPDRVVDLGRAERVGFVVRRISQSATQRTRSEQAWIQPTRGWVEVPLGAEQHVVTNEEMLPLCPVTYQDPRLQRRRRLLLGLIPTASRETYAADSDSSSLAADQDPSQPDPRLADADTRVLDALAAMQLQPAEGVSSAGESEAQREQRVRATAELQKETSRFVLLDLADYLATTLPAVWARVYAGTPPPAQDPAASLYTLLDTTPVDRSTSAPVWRVALQRVWDQRASIVGETSAAPPAAAWNLHDSDVTASRLRTSLIEALGTYTPPSPAVPQPGRSGVLPKFDPRPEVQYVVRCVYQRPTCAPLDTDLVSAPTQAFAIASFFDVDAPSRPIRIPMPVDTTIAGLRKFDKNVTFLLSDQLRAQLARTADLKRALDGSLASGESFDLGIACSMSGPIITICALIVLMIFLNVLNIVFWWLPFARAVLPLKLKARG